MSEKKVYLDFIGCRLNQAEIERMGRQFSARGDAITSDLSEADVVVINTCAVTAAAEKKSRQVIRRAGRASDQVEIIATGCYAELAPDALSRLPNVSLVVANDRKDQLVRIATGDEHVDDFEVEPVLRDPLPPGTMGRTRAFVKVQDGCDNACTFCITTVARGEGRSRNPQEILNEINLLTDMGYQEVVLTGVHLGSFGHDHGDGFGLYELVRAILLRTRIPRLRLSSLEPWDISPDFFDLWQDSRLLPHLHLPLQAGCDATLRRMARRTTRESFAALVDAARRRIPGLAVTTDLIVGFPGETDADFAESIQYTRDVGFARMHVFPYSYREGTPAARLPDHVADEVKDKRRAEAHTLSAELWQAYQVQFIGQTIDVLWESARGASAEGIQWAGLTGNYLRVLTTSHEEIGNTVVAARLLRVEGDAIVAELAPSEQQS